MVRYVLWKSMPQVKELRNYNMILADSSESIQKNWSIGVRHITVLTNSTISGLGIDCWKRVCSRKCFIKPNGA